MIIGRSPKTRQFPELPNNQKKLLPRNAIPAALCKPVLAS